MMQKHRYFGEKPEKIPYLTFHCERKFLFVSSLDYLSFLTVQYSVYEKTIICRLQDMWMTVQMIFSKYIIVCFPSPDVSVLLFYAIKTMGDLKGFGNRMIDCCITSALY